MSQAKDQDQSMEEILQSIKRIIAEEGTPAPSGSDVLELTDMIEEDTPPAMPPSAEAAPQIGTMSIDDIMNTPIENLPQPAPEPEPEPVMEPEPEPVAEQVPTADDALISETTRQASAAALSALKQPVSASTPMRHESPVFRSGQTVEDLVLEGLKPMLRDWLGSHLEPLVRELVEKEIRRLSNK